VTFETGDKKAKLGRPPGHSVRYRQIAADLERRLAQEWPIGKPIPSTSELARAYGVGYQVVRLALKLLKSDGRVRIAHGRPPIAAQGAPVAKILDGGIAIVLGSTLTGCATDGFQAAIWRGIVKRAHTSGRTFVVLQHRNRWRREVPVGLRDMQLKGVLLLSPFRREVLKQYEVIGLPVVVIDQPADELRLHSVSVANYDAGFAAASRLIKLGHRRFGFVRKLVGAIQDVDPDGREREAGVMAACRKAGLDESHVRVFISFKSSQDLGRELNLPARRITAVLTIGSEGATAVESTARRAGLRVPQDLSIAPIVSDKQTARTWSSSWVDFEQFGNMAMEILERAPNKLEHIRVKAIWREGNSIGVPPK
jgi:DNA-binding LacI/PurR family transcriptional regulator